MSQLYDTLRKMNCGYLEIKKRDLFNIQQWLKGLGEGREGGPTNGEGGGGDED